jgi:hypothetical protein
VVEAEVKDHKPKDTGLSEVKVRNYHVCLGLWPKQVTWDRGVLLLYERNSKSHGGVDGDNR